MHLDSPRKTTPQVFNDLRLLSAQILDHPARRETFSTWRRIEDRIHSEDRAQILLVWNKHLAGINEPGEISAVVDTVIEEYGPHL